MTNAYDWAGRVGDSWSGEWRRTDRSFAGLSGALDAAIAGAAPAHGTAVDIGCGAGGTSIALATARPGVTVIGMDISPQLVATAVERGAGIANLSFETGDAATIARSDVDLFFSRHGVMFFDDPVAAFTALRRAAAPDGALVFSCFRDLSLNPWASETVAAITGSAPGRPGTTAGPFAFADLTHVEAILDASGWTGTPTSIDYVYLAGEGANAVDDALSFFLRIGPTASQMAALDVNARTSALARLRDLLATRLHDSAVDFPAAAWIWSCRPGRGSGERE